MIREKELHTFEAYCHTKCQDYFLILCFVDLPTLYDLVNKIKLVYKFILSMCINLYMFRANMCPSSGETTVFLRQLVLVILCGWLSGINSGLKHLQRVTKTQLFSWWWAHIRPKHVKIDKYTKTKFVHKVGFIYKTIPNWFYYTDTNALVKNAN